MSTLVRVLAAYSHLGHWGPITGLRESRNLMQKDAGTSAGVKVSSESSGTVDDEKKLGFWDTLAIIAALGGMMIWILSEPVIMLGKLLLS